MFLPPSCSSGVSAREHLSLNVGFSFPPGEIPRSLGSGGEGGKDCHIFRALTSAKTHLLIHVLLTPHSEIRYVHRGGKRKRHLLEVEKGPGGAEREIFR